MQSQNSDKIITNEHTRRRKSIIRAQLSTTFVSIAILKKKQIINNFENSNNKRQKRFMIANVKKFKKKTFSFFSNKQRSFEKISFNQKKFTKFSLNDARLTILQTYDY
jgi:hypothetical protein